ncbi:MAG: tyrosine-protein phosphatase [Bacteroidales bacterium]|nr:tyrosine-protein phosphatase [Bacteroidales bacterium]
MNRFITILITMIVASSCRTDSDRGVIELQNQQISLSSVHNARQLGGYIIGDKQIKKDLLLRTARLSTLSSEDSLLLSDKYKVQCVYDFRGQDESMEAPDVIPGDSRYISLSIAFADNASRSQYKVDNESQLVTMLLENADHPMIIAMCEKMYDKILLDVESQESYRKFFSDLLTVDPNNGAVLWHCTQGKDRAGCASAMVLAALGADRELIMADFILSKEYYDTQLINVNAETENQKMVISTLLSVNPVIFAKTLDKIDEKYGSFRNYLTECIGVTPEMMKILQDRYLEDRISK